MGTTADFQGPLLESEDSDRKTAKARLSAPLPPDHGLWDHCVAQDQFLETRAANSKFLQTVFLYLHGQCPCMDFPEPHDGHRLECR